MTESLQFRDNQVNDQTFRLRPIAQRQKESLERRMKATGNYSVYREEINKLILHEQEVKDALLKSKFNQKSDLNKSTQHQQKKSC